MIETQVDPLDKIEIMDEVQERLLDTMRFAMKEEGRMRSFFTKFSYCMGWGRGDEGKSPTQIKVVPDFEPHSFLFLITTFRYDDERRAIVSNHPFTLMMYYRPSTDRWETHS